MLRRAAYQLRQAASTRCHQMGFLRTFADDAALKKTPLYDFHVENGGKMVPFAGYSMPIQYKDSIIESTINCRENGSLFDVSHMCGLRLSGKDAIPFLETLVVGDIAGLKNGTGTLSVLTNEKGGIIDDTVITKVDDSHIYLVVNAGCRDKDLAHFDKHLSSFKAKGKDVDWHIYDERSLLALQGPLAAQALQKLTREDLNHLYFSEFRVGEVGGTTTFITRTGYTGEDGFELSVPAEDALDLTKKILEAGEGKIRLTGLGARDSLRLEAGLCLYGNDLNEEITPVEAGLSWTVGKARRANGGFLGADVILQQLRDGPQKRRIGLVTKGAPARSHVEILREDGEVVGEVTSGGFSPCLKKNISMGYVKSGSHKAGTELKVNVRGKLNEAIVTKMPFVACKYFKAP